MKQAYKSGIEGREVLWWEWDSLDKMNEFGENWCEEVSKYLEFKATTLDHWSIDVKCEEEPCNLQGPSLPQQNLIDYPPTQEHNANVNNVELGLIPLSNNLPNLQSQNGDPSTKHRQRKPRITWSDEEHMYVFKFWFLFLFILIWNFILSETEICSILWCRLFLLGIQMCGMSWKRISQDFVRTKTPSQLASHAQKFFERQKMLPSQRRRKSIHDITLPPHFYPHLVQNLSMQDLQVSTPIQDFSMQDLQVPTPIQDFSMQDLQDPTLVQDFSMQYTHVQNFSMQNTQVSNFNQPTNTPGPRWSNSYYWSTCTILFKIPLMLKVFLMQDIQEQ